MSRHLFYLHHENHHFPHFTNKNMCVSITNEEANNIFQTNQILFHSKCAAYRERGEGRAMGWVEDKAGRIFVTYVHFIVELIQLKQADVILWGAYFAHFMALQQQNFSRPTKNETHATQRKLCTHHRRRLPSYLFLYVQLMSGLYFKSAPEVPHHTAELFTSLSTRCSKRIYKKKNMDLLDFTTENSAVNSISMW